MGTYKRRVASAVSLVSRRGAGQLQHSASKNGLGRGTNTITRVLQALVAASSTGEVHARGTGRKRAKRDECGGLLKSSSSFASPLCLLRRTTGVRRSPNVRP